MSNPSPPPGDEPAPKQNLPENQPAPSATTVNNETAFVASLTEVSAHFSSPFPPPEILRQYSELVPDAAERIMAMVEQESKHRRSLETKQLQAEVDDRIAQRYETRLGQWLGFAIGTIAIVGGVVSSIFGSPVAGGFIGTGGVVGLVAVFVLGRYFEAKQKASE